MEKDFEEFIALRCKRAIEESSEYMKKECNNADQDELQTIAEELCYRKGFSDAMAILKCSQKV